MQKESVEKNICKKKYMNPTIYNGQCKKKHKNTVEKYKI